MTLAIPVITTNQAPKPPEIKEELPSWSPATVTTSSNSKANPLWEEQRSAKQHLAKLPIPTSEQLAPGHKSEWKLWKSLNRLHTGMGRSKTNMSKWGYADTADTACECGTSEQTMQHLQYWDAHFSKMNAAWKIWQLLMRRLSTVQEARAWPNIWLNSEMMDTKEDLN